MEAQLFYPRKSRLTRVFAIITANKLLLVGSLIVCLVVCTAIFVSIDDVVYEGALIERILHSPYQMNARERLSPPSASHPLGTDQLGRDVLARIIYGSRVSIQVGLLAVGLSGAIGTVIGVLAGYIGGKFDDFVMRIVDILLAFPGLILAIAIAGFLGPSLTNVIIALSAKAWVSYARVMRANVLKMKDVEYIQAAKALGSSEARIIFKNILPNVATPMIILATMELGSIIISEAGLSFLGLGPQPPMASWGNMLNLGRAHITTAWWLSAFPGLAIFLTVMGFNLLGDALADAFDPKITLPTRR